LDDTARFLPTLGLLAVLSAACSERWITRRRESYHSSMQFIEQFRNHEFFETIIFVKDLSK